MKILYGSIVGYTANPGGWSALLSFTVTPGVTYDVQSTVDGVAWTNSGLTVFFPNNTPPDAAKWSSSLTYPNGSPLRLQEQAKGNK